MDSTPLAKQKSRTHQTQSNSKISKLTKPRLVPPKEAKAQHNYQTQLEMQLPLK